MKARTALLAIGILLAFLPAACSRHAALAAGSAAAVGSSLHGAP